MLDVGCKIKLRLEKILYPVRRVISDAENAAEHSSHVTAGSPEELAAVIGCLFSTALRRRWWRWLGRGRSRRRRSIVRRACAAAASGGREDVI
eukprot:COSAG01_NODE_8556_length_2743_cov_8.364977_4_plen_93_part_00